MDDSSELELCRATNIPYSSQCATLPVPPQLPARVLVGAGAYCPFLESS